MPKKLTIDVSVFIKALLEDELTDIALNLFEYINKNDIEIINPSIFEYEVIRLCVLNNIDLKQVNFLLRAQKLANLTLVKPTLGVTSKAKQLIEQTLALKEYPPSFYDTVYHAVAFIQGTVFITADPIYYNKVKKHSKNIILFSKNIVSELKLA